MLCQTDRHHFQKTALMFSFEIRMRFDLVVYDDPVCLICQSVAVYWCFCLIIPCSDLYDIHGSAYRDTDVFFRNAVSFQDLQIAFRCAAAMAAHGRHDERTGSPFFQLFTDRSDDHRIIGDPPAADSNSDPFSDYKRGIILSFEFFFQMTGNIRDPVGAELLPYPDHVRQNHIIKSLDRDCDVREINILHDLMPPCFSDSNITYEHSLTGIHDCRTQKETQPQDRR